MNKSSILASVLVATALCAAFYFGVNTSNAEMNPLLTELQDELGVLKSQVQQHEDINQIMNLQRIYGYYVDKGQWPQVADLFSDNGTIEIAGRGEFRGKDRILEYLYHIVPGEENTTGLAYGTLMNHMNLQPVIHIMPDGVTAKGRWRAFMQVAQKDTTAMWGEGTYENEYVKENGVWKISKLHTYINYYVDYYEGWDKGGIALFGEIEGLSPDGETTVEYQPFPNFFIPPYHYENPVTGQ